MKCFIDLRVAGPRPDQIALFEALKTISVPGWTREPEFEKRGLKISSTPVLVFQCEGTASRPAALVWLDLREDSLDVANIVPPEPGRIEMDDYNQILLEFAEKIIKPNLGSLTLETTSEIFSLTDHLSPEAAHALERFSHSANHDTGTSHPSDQLTFDRFLILAHDTHGTLSVPELENWLIDQNWSGKLAERLTIQYEQGLSLLERYDGYLAGK